MTAAASDWRLKLRQAVAKHQRGELSEAILLYASVLEDRPDNADALHLVGVALEQSGAAEKGLPFVEQAVRLEPAVSAYRNSLGNIHKALNDRPAARAAYAEAIQLDPLNAEAHNNLALICQADADWDAAAAHFNAALRADPAYAAARFNLATIDWRAGRRDHALAQFRIALQAEPSYALQVAQLARRCIAEKDGDAARQLVGLIEGHPLSSAEWYILRGGMAGVDGDLVGAEQAYRMALAIEPGNLDALRLLGKQLVDREAYADAAPLIERAQSLQPEDTGLLVSLGFVLTRAGATAKAVQVLQQAVARRPEEVGAWIDLAQSLSKLQRHDEAAEAYRRAIAQAPDRAEIYANLAGVEVKRGDYDAAEAACRTALALDPVSHVARGNLANVHELRRQLVPAEQIYRSLIADQPDDGTSHNNLGIMLLRQGRYAEGWPHFAWRWKSNGWTTPDYSRGLPRWDGSRRPEGRLLIWREQGVGDEILYASLLPDLVATGHDVVLATDRRLVPLFQRSFPAVHVVDNAEPFDAGALGLSCQRPFGDLGSIFRPDAASFAGQPDRYLAADLALRDRLRARYRTQVAAGSLLVGAAWSSNNPYTGSSKSVALGDMAPLLSRPGLAAISLQYGAAAEAIADLKARTGIAVIEDTEIDPLRSIDAQAAQIAALDLVVTISTAAAHLAAALGVPTLLLLPEERGQLWYWGHQGERTPWYRSVRICRNEPGGDVPAVIARARPMLEEMLGTLSQ